MTAMDPLRVIRDGSLDGVALNDWQRRVAANPSPERDSLFEDLQFFRVKYAITDEDITPAFTRLRQLIEFNDRELEPHRQAVRITDDLMRVARQQREANVLMKSPESIQRLARRLRPHLQVLASPAGHSARIVVEARRVVADVVRTTPADRLASDTLRHELRATCHDELLIFVERRAA